MIVEVTPEEFWARPEVPALAAMYEAECRCAGLPPAKPDVDLYQKMHSVGALRALILLSGDEMVGFVVVLISPVAHYSAKIAVTESLYVSPDHRGAGWRLIKRAETVAQEAGAIGLFISAPASGVLEQVMAKDISGYKHSNTVFFKGFIK